MPITATLKLLCSTLERCLLKVTIFDVNALPRQELDLGIRKLLGSSQSLGQFIESDLSPIEDKTVYKLADKFNNNYIYFKLPKDEDNLILFIGPFHSTHLNREQILTMVEQMDIPATMTQEVEKYYSSVPFISDDSHIHALLDVFFEAIWGGSMGYSTKNIYIGASETSDWYADSSPTPPDMISWKIKLMEERYTQENKMMSAVAAGDLDKVKLMISMFSTHNFEQRLSDSLRNTKNYCIIMNTLLRKAAENGGVHPVYIDKTSSKLAVKIEQLRNIDQAGDLMHEMIKSYCKLVKKHTTKSYSLPVQRAITAIEYDLTADLGLASIAKMQDINASYLSTIFKKETGLTLTEYVNKKRMELAMKLLETTRLQIQTIAQQCGILDVHYFSRMFKKHTGVTPKMYRDTLQK